MKKTKIICTIGPASDKPEIIRELILEGMDVARFNFSHGSHEQHKQTMKKIADIREELNMHIATLLDTKGPEIRIGQFENGKIELEKGQIFTLTTDEIMGDEAKVSISYKNLVNDVSVGGSILIDDGLVSMTILSVSNTDITCKVLNDGIISNNKGVNVPGAHLSMPFVSQKDYEDILFGIENNFDFIAASFTRTADDILQVRNILNDNNCQKINIIAKIENRQGVSNIDEIIRVSDGIMVARGDMGVEIPLEEVPGIQKMIIKKVYNAGKQVITATQMLDSMMKNPRPTRAEATDVANAIYDGTSAIMLSGETAAGMYPVESLKTMVKIAKKTEDDIDYVGRFKTRESTKNQDVTNAISHATCTTAIDLSAAAIITVTKSGKTARMISKYRPDCLIIGCSTYDYICRQMNLSWGVKPLLIDEENSTDDLFDHAVDTSENAGLIKQGELTVITAGVPLGISGTTNLIKVHVAGHILITGKGIVPKSACASLCVCNNEEELIANFKEGDIIVIPETSNLIISQIKLSRGLVVESDGMNSHAAIVGLSLDIPVILNAVHATKILKSGAVVTVDGERGTVFCNKRL